MTWFSGFVPTMLNSCKFINLNYMLVSCRPGSGSVGSVCDASSGPRLWMGDGGGIRRCPVPVSSPRLGSGPYSYT